MKWSRRDLPFLIPALAAAQTAARKETLPSSTFRYEDLPVRKNGPGASRQFFNGLTHTGHLVDMHETELPAGEAPHPPHHHPNEEVLMIREGTMEVTISGKTTRMGPGSVAYVASNEEHGWRNVGTTRARYFVLALGETK